MRASEEEIQELATALGEKFTTDETTIRPYMRDQSWMVPEGTPIGAVFAQSAQDVSTALKWANAHKVPVSVRTGGSGLAGGAVSYADGLIISLDKMNRILEINPENSYAIVEPGIINEEFNRQLGLEGYFFAPDPASASIATIGGNIATNAGGLRAVSYGVTIDWVKGLEVVLADGRIIHTGSKTIKNVSSLNLTQLFVGSEGTLGVVTQATVKIERLPEHEPYTFLASFDSIEDAGYATIAMRDSDNRPVSLELIDAFTVDLVNKRHPDMQVPQPGAALLLGQTLGENAEEQANTMAELCKEFGASETHVEKGNDLLAVRRDAYPALQDAGMPVIGDVSVPIASLAEVIQGIEELSQKYNRRVAIIGHAGDGNLHPIVQCGEGLEESAAAEALLDEIVKMAIEPGGVISGEHGIGYLKRHDLPEMLSQDVIDVQRSIKNALDPNNILTPGRKVY
ncbi:MAG: FAD-binding protein [Bifidobacteriaceae bacterium]|jgi:glycolate oxidase|nr:FAD-binding protein [Bifidobacteriaceae bacterium]MCI1915090.1 FAD-binding protein [Bifidobacteriaceae bacterium]